MNGFRLEPYGRRGLLASGLSLITAGALSGCAPEPLVLHIGDQRGSIHSLLKAAGELDNVPYAIDWDIFPVGAPLVEAIKAGAVDFGYVGSSTMTFALGTQAAIKAISVWTMKGYGSGVLVRQDAPIHAVPDLRGKRVCVVKGSPGHLLVVRALKAADVPLSAVTMVYLSAGDARAALTSGAVDAWAIWDPYLAIGELQDHDRVIVTSEHLSPEVECGVASQNAIAHKRPQLLDFIGRVQRAYRWADTHLDAVAKAYASDTGVPFDIAHFVRGRSHVEVLSAISDEAIAEHQQAADIYTEIGLIPRRIQVAQIYDRSFVLPAPRS